jgi:hypothetical protein
MVDVDGRMDGWTTFTSSSLILIQVNTGNTQIVTGLTQSQLGGCVTGSNSLTWNGTRNNSFGAIHLGVENLATMGPNWGTGYVDTGAGCTNDRQGWGFGHIAYVNNTQGWGWDSDNLGSQNFQIGAR